MTHSILSPSSANRRMVCPGSALLEQEVPELEESEVAREGTAAHWVAAQFLSPCEGEPHVGMEAPNGEIITEEMMQFAKNYFHYITGIFSNTKDIVSPMLHIEHTLTMSYIHESSFGTPDVFFKIGNDIHVIDYKFGFKEVPIENNYQLISYAIGVAEFFKIDISAFDDYNYHLHMVQPRLFDPTKVFKKITLNSYQLRYELELLRENANLALSTQAPCKPSSHCNYCKARVVCDALSKSSFEIADAIRQFNPIIKDENELGNELKYLLQAQKLLDARVSGLMEHGLQYAKEGKKVPNFTVQQSYGREKWKGSTDEIKALGELYGVNLLKPNDLVTPKQAIKAGLSAELVRLHSETLPGALKLVEEKLDDIKKLLTLESTTV